MTLETTDLPIVIDQYTLAAIIQMKSDTNAVSVRVTREALNLLGFVSGDARAFCESKREYFRDIANEKYKNRDVIIYEMDIRRYQSSNLGA